MWQLKIKRNLWILLTQIDSWNLELLPEFPGHIVHLIPVQAPIISLKTGAKKLSHSQIFIFTISLKFLGHSTYILVINDIITIEINIWKRNSTVKKIPIRAEFRPKFNAFDQSFDQFYCLFFSVEFPFHIFISMIITLCALFFTIFTVFLCIISFKIK